MSGISALTLYSDRMTRARRSSPVPQLTCQGKPCRTFQPTVVQCTAVGDSGYGMEWKCSAELPNSMKLGGVEVSCEGWNNADDPYILKGSCGLTYNLVKSSAAYDNDDYYTPSDGMSLTSILTVLAVLYFLYTFLTRTPTTPLPRNASRLQRFFGGWGGGPGGGGGGGGHGGTPAPPPPYSKDSNAVPTPTQAAGGFQPGFWTGIAGGLAGAALGNSLFGQNQNLRRDQGYYGNTGMGGWGNNGGGGGGMFGGGGGGMRSGGSGGGTSSSTGFGGTRNR